MPALLGPHLELVACCDSLSVREGLAARKDKTEDKRATALMRALDCASERHGSRALYYGVAGPKRSGLAYAAKALLAAHDHSLERSARGALHVRKL